MVCSTGLLIRFPSKSTRKFRQFFGPEPGSPPDSRRLQTVSENPYRRESDGVRIMRQRGRAAHSWTPAPCAPRVRLTRPSTPMTPTPNELEIRRTRSLSAKWATLHVQLVIHYDLIGCRQSPSLFRLSNWPKIARSEFVRFQPVAAAQDAALGLCRDCPNTLLVPQERRRRAEQQGCAERLPYPTANHPESLAGPVRVALAAGQAR